LGYSASLSSSARVLINGKETDWIPVSGFETIDIAGVTCRLEVVSSDGSSIEMVVSCADN